MCLGGNLLSTVPTNHVELTRRAVASYWSTLQEQGTRQRDGDADRGKRSAVTGGKQMNGFCHLISELLRANGFTDEHIHIEQKLELPGYFRPTKRWDMVVVFEGKLVAALEFKSMAGSFGNNFNNRAEEAIGTGADMRLALKKGVMGKGARPWIGWLMLLEDSVESTRTASVKEPHFPVLRDFQQQSIAGRFAVLFRKLVEERYFDSTALLMCTRTAGQTGLYTEPHQDLAMKPFLTSLANHLQQFRRY
ncbi:PaeR7I family type II restriction endonuclease [Corallococcus sp. AS-1-12]|nr:PaeR7I family type II restriction endonuclease [Corallococcus sp. AS-1-12]